MKPTSPSCGTNKNENILKTGGFHVTIKNKIIYT